MAGTVERTDPKLWDKLKAMLRAAAKAARPANGRRARRSSPWPTTRRTMAGTDGERILKIKAARPADLTEQDYSDMRKVVGYVHRHLAQRPKGDVTDARWRRSLMNWGHDPLKDH